MDTHTFAIYGGAHFIYMYFMTFVVFIFFLSPLLYHKYFAWESESKTAITGRKHSESWGESAHKIL